VHDSGRALVEDREGDRARRPIAVHLDRVAREGGVERTDVARMVEVDPAVAVHGVADAGGGVARRLGRQRLAFATA